MHLSPAAGAAPSSASATHLRHPPLFASPHHISFRKIPSFLPIKGPISTISRQIRVTSSASSSSPSFSENVGRKVRVKVPIKVHHVLKLPGLNLDGIVGVVKQYVGVWKGKRITPNLPFKIEFLAQKDGQSAPIKFFAHLREAEFEYVMSDSE